MCRYLLYITESHYKLTMSFINCCCEFFICIDLNHLRLHSNFFIFIFSVSLFSLFYLDGKELTKTEVKEDGQG